MMSPKRVAYVITRSDSIGGALVHVRDLSLAMLEQGHDVTVLVGGDGPFVRELADRNIPHLTLRHLKRSLRPHRDFLSLLELRQALSRLQPNLVSTHSSKAGWLGRLAAYSLNIPVIFTAHGWAFTDGVTPGAAAVYRWAERLAAPMTDMIITVSEYDRNLALTHHVAPPDKLVTIHNGMPDIPDSLRADATKSPPRIIMVARFEEQKDHRTLLRALAGLRDLPWELELVGDGPLMPSTQHLARELGIADRVWFMGSRTDVAERLARAQVFVLTSCWEGFPRSILEAMRAQLPVVATSVAGVPESVVHGSTGFLVPRKDLAAVQQALRHLLGDASLRGRMGYAGRRRYETMFTFKHMLAKTVAVYDQVMLQRTRYPNQP